MECDGWLEDDRRNAGAVMVRGVPLLSTYNYNVKNVMYIHNKVRYKEL